ncbi:hypothetical protein ACFV1T_20105, partial [Streptomyces vinaceus]
LVIEAGRSHPAVGGELRFTEDWLPYQVATELRRHADAGLPVPPPGAPPGTAPVTALDAAPTASAPRAPVPAGPPGSPAAQDPP